MKFYTLPPVKMMLLFCIVVIFQFSCSKDSDLLAELAIFETQQAKNIGQFIVDDTFFIASSGSNILDVLANDTFENTEEVVITETTSPSNGTVEINSDNTLTYTPETTPETEDTFTYTTEVINSDASVSTETGSVTVSINDQSKGQGSIWYTDFETDQWNLSGSGVGTWEYEADRGVPRTTTNSRAGSRAVHLGDYNGHVTRNEIHRNRLSTWGEHWIGFSIKVTEAAQNSRVYAQFRNMRPQGSPDFGGVNPVTLRQGSAGKMYFATSTDETKVDVIQKSGASTGTERTYFDYNLDEWIDVVIHWELDPVDGFLEIWVNGEKIIDETGTTTYRYANVSGIPYDGDIKHTIGVYWSSKNSPQGDVYFDEYKVWKGPGTYEDVAPGRN